MSLHNISQKAAVTRQWKAEKEKKISLPKPVFGILDKNQKAQLLEYVKSMGESISGLSPRS